MTIPHLLVHDRRDSVGVVVVEGVEAGQELFCVVTEDNSDFTMRAEEAVPIGHKLALKDIPRDENVIKYGQDIGRAIAPIKKGTHVHIHNLKTKRW